MIMQNAKQEKIAIRTPPGGSNSRFDLWLAGQLRDHLSRSRIQDLIRSGAVTVNGQCPALRSRVPAEAIVLISLPPPLPAKPEAEDIPLRIIFEDESMLVLDKPPGLVVHPAPGHASGTLVNALLNHCPNLEGIGGEQRPGIVHRLDRDTSGLMVVAKNDRSMLALSRAFKRHETRKQYLVLAHGSPSREKGTIREDVGRHPVMRKKMVAGRGRRAVTHYAIRQKFARTCELCLRIETGRTHQIRVHLAHVRLPVIGDPLYGSRSLDATLPRPAGRQMLHANILSFPHPLTSRLVEFNASPPDDYLDMLAALGEQDRH